MANNKVEISGEELFDLIEQLAYILPDDYYLSMVLCGGSALAIYYPHLEYETTTDADVFDYYSAELPNSLDPYIRQIAHDNKIGDDWLNDAIMRHNDRDYEHNLTKAEYMNFIENYNEPEYFYNSNDNAVIEMYYLSLLGIIASKLMAGRTKDFDALSDIVPQIYNDPDELIDDFYNKALSFTRSGTGHFDLICERITELF